MSRLKVEKGSTKNTKYGFLTIFGLNEGDDGIAHRAWRIA